MFDNIKTTLKSMVNPSNATPGIRHPEIDSNYELFYKNYGFVFEANKTAGSYNRYIRAFQNPYVFQCIEAEINALTSCGFDIKTADDTSTPSIDHKNYLTNLFNNPLGYQNDMTYTIQLGLIVRSLELTGDTFLEVSYDDHFGTVNGFRYIQPQLLIYDSERDVYAYRNNTNLYYEPNELIHIYEPHPLKTHTSHFGISKVDNIADQINLMLNILKYNNDVVANDGLSPKAVLSFDKDISDTSFKQELARLSALKPKQKRGGTLAVKGASFQSPSTANNIDWLQLSIFCRDTVLSNYGIPPIFLGIVETANLGTGTGESQREVFKTVISRRAKLIEDGFNKCLGRNGFKEVFDIQEMDIEDKVKRIDIESKKLQSSVLTVNEVRNGYNLDPVPWGDTPVTYTTLPEETSIDEEITLKHIPESLSADKMPIKKYKDYVYQNELLDYGVKK